MRKKDKGRKKYGRNVIKDNLKLYALMFPALFLIFLFSYTTLYGVVIAFQEYAPGLPMFGSGVKWVGLKWIRRFVTTHYFSRLLKNTLILSFYNLVFGFTAPILFALLLDQLRALRYKKLVQTASYLPYFVSMVVVAGMVISFIDKNGLITRFLMLFGGENQSYLMNSKAFPWTYTLTNVWKSFGFNSILYCSIMSSIDPTLYEAARMDGANRWQQVRYITLPGLKNIIAIQLIFAVGGILSSNTELILLLYTPATYDVADVIGTYTYRIGILGGQYSYTTAAGIFMAFIAFTLTYIANKISDKLTGFGLW